MEEFKPPIVVQRIYSFHNDTHRHVQHTYNDRGFHLDRVEELNLLD